MTEPVTAIKIDRYLSEHPGATRVEVAAALGISRQRLSQVVIQHGITGFWKPSPRTCSNCKGPLGRRTKGELCVQCIPKKTYPCARCGKERTKRSRSKVTGLPCEICRDCYYEEKRALPRNRILTLTCGNCQAEFQRPAWKELQYRSARQYVDHASCSPKCALALGRVRLKGA